MVAVPTGKEGATLVMLRTVIVRVAVVVFEESSASLAVTAIVYG